ncbi:MULTISPECIES: prolipoprotein diacylglyceryl transferase [Mammaliicoccus]|jgi:phosphatidylglycerol:prolipoprotein diacylglycerol transferase|uniref:prolipoprotein diacylglyceryl transferase n=1 Tax=Mammaliicoccus TaxID=2803850 RepID=UPI000CD1740F|nr:MULTISPECIES: prolipoprotein diacylglyceryl transferase [Mammaliicoccus]HBV03160.1 prolipoprotein diacylglyceryl transferase [Staphylococcus sp.]MDQ7141532.1 prolipoprotein diacylglyceryl transferase [Mammaliicoccus lentus]POA07363.1 prolipoprotein diacylglyceryl transferase [Mammaliicoccus lentus]WHI54278.1 prolipoprotein diacylglyceryl transferase [Mammaliicoccus lentus]WHI56800.1 prolipoprotein diacylglyceryl transferase [Mammaliicoccus lentus]
MMEVLGIDPVAIQLGPLSIRWYGIIIASGILIGYLMAQSTAKKVGIKEETLIDLIIWCVVMAIICARIYYVAFEWEYYSQHLAEIPLIMNGGIAIHGGLIGAFLTGAILCRVKNLSFFQMVDIVAPGIILAQAIGRWGNFINQEAHGGPVSRSFLENIHIPDFIINQMQIDGVFYQPTFLYESIWNIIGFIILLLIRPHLKIGETFFAYLIYYSIGRYFIEGLRTDSLMLTEYLRIAQVISIVIIIASIIFILYRRIRYDLPKFREVKGYYHNSN